MVSVRWRCATGLMDRMRGLLGQAPLAPGEALWIAPCRAVHTIGLGDAIDVIFVDKRARVLRIVHRLRPGRLAWCSRAWATIELAAGEATRVGWKEGMVVLPGSLLESAQPGAGAD